jgi:hypothetical protein
METMIEMVRAAAERGGRNRYACSLSAWNLFRQLGETFGWQPQGTTYIPAAGSKQLQLARHDYTPGVAEDSKCVESEDALAWAQSLEKARSSSHLHVLISQTIADASAGAAPDAEAEQTRARLEATMDEFIEYAYSGAFSFHSRN